MQISRIEGLPFSFDDLDISADEHFIFAHTINTMGFSKTEENNDDSKEILRRSYVY